MVFVGYVFFSSMMITNDVALLTFVPFTIAVLSEVGTDRTLDPRCGPRNNCGESRQYDDSHRQPTKFVLVLSKWMDGRTFSTLDAAANIRLSSGHWDIALAATESIVSTYFYGSGTRA